MERSAAAAARFLGSVSQFKVYEDYLDSKVTPVDLFYLKSRDLARKLVEHGHKGTVLSREEFEEKKAAAQAAEAARSNALYNRSRPVFHIKFNLVRLRLRTLASAGKELKDNFLRALAEREEANRSGKMTKKLLCARVSSPGRRLRRSAHRQRLVFSSSRTPLPMSPPPYPPPCQNSGLTLRFFSLAQCGLAPSAITVLFTPCAPSRELRSSNRLPKSRLVT
ncbi:cilia- and flagella-associated protein 299 isoform X3 [Scophthalmus maximus]|uniref:cilia- and flagella-associated protein 299 isoform X3 n=1 Tax=Scophthalmus maximus TaxID=52904 RepID=UPI001FA85991|nr:cilia- and flagella-associated protein 299 isoform X3 [Scophthalmus maximus]